ncbi:MAG: methyltransferase [Patescibacteria group bacterium]
MATERGTIEKLVFGGQGLARLGGGRVAFVWNALPGEDVTFEIVKKRRGTMEGIATEIHTPSPDRIAPREATYLSTSPWQIMTWEAEQRWKREVARETYKKLGGFDVGEISIVGDEAHMYGYRNKMEFSFFTKTPDAPLELAFYERGKSWKQPAEGSALALPEINAVAIRIRDWLRAQRVDRRELKTLIVRGDGHGHAIAGLFAKEVINVESYPELDDMLRGFHIYYSNPKSPASVITDVLYSSGDESLTVALHDKKMTFGLMSFFQVNVPIFESVLDRVTSLLPKATPIVDLYSGVGSIGLSLANEDHDTVLVESWEEATRYAKQNATMNGIDRVRIVVAPAERVTKEITSDATLIVDPPRTGLHADVVAAIIAKRSPIVFYLSCNLSTQARDVALLLPHYTIAHTELFNFFPRTPHIEGLVVLKAKS